MYSQIVTDAKAWDGDSRDPSYLYPRSRLDRIVAASTRWADALSRVPPLPPVGATFLAASRRACAGPWCGSGHHRRRRVLAVSALTAGGLALQNHVDTDQQHAIALSRQLLAAASLAIDTEDPTTARQLAVAAFYVSPTDQARSAIAAMLAEQQQSGTMFTEASANGWRSARTASC